MRYRRLGRTGLDISELSFGAARGARSDRSAFVRTVRACVDAGINLFDTAEGYDAFNRSSWMLNRDGVKMVIDCSATRTTTA